jgi:hypothetical protein
MAQKDDDMELDIFELVDPSRSPRRFPQAANVLTVTMFFSQNTWRLAKRVPNFPETRIC